MEIPAGVDTREPNHKPRLIVFRHKVDPGDLTVIEIARHRLEDHKETQRRQHHCRPDQNTPLLLAEFEPLLHDIRQIEAADQKSKEAEDAAREQNPELIFVEIMAHLAVESSLFCRFKVSVPCQGLYAYF